MKNRLESVWNKLPLSNIYQWQTGLLVQRVEESNLAKQQRKFTSVFQMTLLPELSWAGFSTGVTVPWFPDHICIYVHPSFISRYDFIKEIRSQWPIRSQKIFDARTRCSLLSEVNGIGYTDNKPLLSSNILLISVDQFPNIALFGS